MDKLTHIDIAVSKEGLLILRREWQRTLIKVSRDLIELHRIRDRKRNQSQRDDYKRIRNLVNQCESTLNLIEQALTQCDDKGPIK